MDNQYYDENYIVNILRKLFQELDSFDIEGIIDSENIKSEEKKEKRRDYLEQFEETENQKKLKKELSDEVTKILERGSSKTERERKVQKEQLNKVKEHIRKSEEKKNTNRNYPLSLLPEYTALIEDYVPKIFIFYDENKMGYSLEEALREHITIIRNLSFIAWENFSKKRLKNQFAPKLGKNKNYKENIDNFQNKLQAVYDLMGGGFYPLSKDGKVLENELIKAFANPSNYVVERKTGKNIDMSLIKKNLEKYHLTNKKDINKYMRQLSFIFK